MESNDTVGPPRRKRRIPKVRHLALGALVLFVLFQLVPYGHSTSNPKVNVIPEWPSDEVQRLAEKTCADCHSNTTQWPIYARIAPGSWLMARDVAEGRSVLNWSEPCGEADEVREVIAEGEMPPWQYTLIHRNAILTDAETKTLADGLAKALESTPMGECPDGE